MALTSNLYQPPHIPGYTLRLVACKPQQRCQEVLALYLSMANMIFMMREMISMMTIYFHDDTIYSYEAKNYFHDDNFFYINEDHLCSVRGHLLPHAVV